MNSRTVYLPGLNGLRAIAALAVVITHITFDLESFNLDPFILGTNKNGMPRGIDLAGFGVSIFFAISGFLITFLLQNEKEVQPINIKNFYLRRILRIWPLYYLYLSIAILTILVFGFDLNIKSLFLYLSFAANIPYILYIPLKFVTHYWSLGVEEQFYLFWPWVNKKINRIILFIVPAIVILIGIKLFLHFFYPHSIIERIIHITRFHCMLIGALGAILYKQKNKFFLKFADNKLSQAISLAIILALIINKFHIASVLDNEIVSAVTVVLIIGQINIKNRMLNLDSDVLDFLGKISYGIYVYHPLVIFFVSKVLSGMETQSIYKYIIVYSSSTVATVLISYLSYEYIEKYFLRLKRNISVIHSSGTKHYTQEDYDKSQPLPVTTPMKAGS